MRLNYFIVILLLAFLSCKKEKPCPLITKPYKQKIFEFKAIDASDSFGYCGVIIFAKIDSGSDITVFKGINLPTKLQTHVLYKGLFEVLPESFLCKNDIPKSISLVDTQTVTPHFVKIINWEEK